ncbi:MAG: hypothetical protein ABL949_13755 [Fimbriimonadaceae bacterium]
MRNRLTRWPYPGSRLEFAAATRFSLEGLPAFLRSLPNKEVGANQVLDPNTGIRSVGTCIKKLLREFGAEIELYRTPVAQLQKNLDRLSPEFNRVIKAYRVTTVPKEAIHHNQAN